MPQKTEQIEFEQRLQFQCDAPWVEHAGQVLLANSARRINVKVDPTQLEAGLHYAELTGTDPAHPERGPLVRLPITVVIPEQPDGTLLENGSHPEKRRIDPAFPHRTGRRHLGRSTY